MRKIDNQVSENIQTIYLFAKKLPFKSKRQAKKLCLHIVFIFTIFQPLSRCAYPVIMSLSQGGINKWSPIEQNNILNNKNSYS